MNSFYIPTIHTSYTENEIINIFSNRYIGEVTSVDFIPHKKYKNYRSAFVHCHDTNSVVQYHFGKCQQKKLELHFDDNTYWVILKNKNPRSPSISKDVTFENKLEELQSNLDELQSIVDKQTRQIKRLGDSIENLWGIMRTVYGTKESNETTIIDDVVSDVSYTYETDFEGYDEEISTK